MWLVNMNCLGVLGKKLAGVKGGKMVKNGEKIVKKVNLFRWATQE